jgi:phosphoenolpyruvate carboxykinase (ATP)
MKKGLFTIFHFIMPDQGTLSLHASATEGPEGDTSILFGLSGTGKTTLSHDPKRRLIGDDETMWMPTGISNIEGGSYAKCIGLNPLDEPLIYNAIKFGAIVENARFTDKHRREINYNDTSITQNTRVSYPLEYVPNAKVPAVGGHPNNLIFLTCDANGLLPPVSKLTNEQAIYHFLSGYTATVGGVLSGNETTSATFSACFGEIFLPRHPIVYATLLQSKILKHKPHIYLVNTGWINGRTGVGQVRPADPAHPNEVHASDHRRHPQRRTGKRRTGRFPCVQL